MPDFGITYQGPMTFFLAGELDMATVPSLSAAISDSIGAGGPITLDLSGLTFIDSSGVGAILKASKDHLPNGCIVLHGVHAGTQRVVELMGVEKTSNIHVLPCLIAV
jgi:anti-sigma B factor antagonist